MSLALKSGLGPHMGPVDGVVLSFFGAQSTAIALIKLL
ncbi:50S ribosomal protein L13 [Rhodobacteraceae bacterium HTCC2150]|nr:50S ribosomal protein L13 [Rhodobacteraceae bacterium HTCC2150]